MYLCQEDCVANYRRKNSQYYFEKKCEQCLTDILQNEDKSYCWQTKHFCSVNCLSNYFVFNYHYLLFGVKYFYYTVAKSLTY